MTDIADAIMKAAERRMRIGGFHGFSFREIAADVGIKSSSVHYHFPTKDDLAAEVVRRYTDELSEKMDRNIEIDPDPISVWTKAFRGTLLSDERLCPCMVLGAGALDIPPKVSFEVKRFFTMCLEKLIAEGLSRDDAAKFLSTLTGATIIAVATGDIDTYDRAICSPMNHRDPAVAA
jgi:TetR/AcrR family transcriptional regulator, transcriptional repressor for nem operon